MKHNIVIFSRQFGAESGEYQEIIKSLNEEIYEFTQEIEIIHFVTTIVTRNTPNNWGSITITIHYEV